MATRGRPPKPKPVPAPKPPAPVSEALNLDKLSQKDLGKILNFSPRTIRDWIVAAQETDNPFPSHLDSGNTLVYRLAEVVAWLREDAARRATARLESSPVNQAEAQLRKTTAEATLKEISIAREQGRLVDREDIETTWNGALSRFKNVLLNGKGTFADKVMALESADFISISEVYSNLIHDALVELSELVVDTTDDEVETVEVDLPGKR